MLLAVSQLCLGLFLTVWMYYKCLVLNKINFSKSRIQFRINDLFYNWRVITALFSSTGLRIVVINNYAWKETICHNALKIINVVYLTPLCRYQYQHSPWNCITNSLKFRYSHLPTSSMFGKYFLENILKHNKIK